MALLQVCFLQKAAGFCLLLQTILLTHWNLVLTLGEKIMQKPFKTLFRVSLLAIVGCVIPEAVRYSMECLFLGLCV